MHKNAMGYICLVPEKIEALMGEGVKEPDFPPSKLIEHKQYLLNEFQISEDMKITGREQDFDFFVPPLLGKNIAKHFELMARELFSPYKDALNKLVRKDHASAPEFFVLRAGWTKYEEGEEPIPVEYPDSEAYCFDTETFVTADRFAFPIIATAVDHRAVYIWLHESLVDATVDYKPCLVPVGRGSHRLLVAHNAAYDAARIEERYTLGENKIAFLDTMSMQRVIAGFSDAHKWIASAKAAPKDQVGYFRKMKRFGSGMSLVKSYEFITGKRLEPGLKEIRDIFVKAKTLDEIRDKIDLCLEYAVNDSLLLYELFKKQWVKYRAQIPSWVPVVGAIQLANSIVPVEPDWYDWQRHCETEYQKLVVEIEEDLAQLADDTYRDWALGKLDPEKDDWLKHLDWSYPDKESNPLYKVPSWYQERIKTGEPLKLSTRVELAHYLLRVKWLGKPLVMNKERKEDGKGWNKSWGIFDDKGNFEKMPHYKTPGANVGIVLSEKYLHHFDAGRLVSDNPKARAIIEKASLISYWISKRGLVLSRPAFITEVPETHEPWLTTAPQVIPHNTQSHRTGESLFLTLAAHTAPKVGSEVKNKVKAPPGYKIIGFDFDSQEAVILATYADSEFGSSGSTAYGHIFLVGSKETEDDIHWTIAKMAGVSRNCGKSCVYAMSYGGGFRTVVNTIRTFHPEVSKESAEAFAMKTIEALKGKKDYDTGRYAGGTGSAFFNKILNEMLTDPHPSTPLLGSKIQPSLIPANCDENGSPSQMNWFVQSCGSSTGMLSAVIVAALWLIKQSGLEKTTRFLVSIHDEVWFLAKEEDAELVAYLLQVAHCWVWCLLHYKVGLYDMPVGRAFASGIAIDTILRKDCRKEIRTPTFEHKEKGYEITMLELVKKGYSDQVKQLWEDLNAGRGSHQ